MVPSFLIIGAQKCGTTSLHALLGRHPEVCMCRMKEPHFFSHDDRYARGWAWYQSLYENADRFRASGETSPSYTQELLRDAAVERIARHAPDVKFIYIVRHPLDRIESSFMQLRRIGKPIPGSFVKALRRHPEFVHTSNYWRQLEAYRRTFGEEKLLVLFFEDFLADPHAVLARIFEFIGVDAAVRIEDADRPHKESLGRLSETPVVATMRRTRWFAPLRDALPGGLRNSLKRMLKKRVTERPRWDRETRQWAIDLLGGDVRRFLSHYAKPQTFWTLDPTPPHLSAPFAAIDRDDDD